MCAPTNEKKTIEQPLPDPGSSDTFQPKEGGWFTEEQQRAILQKELNTKDTDLATLRRRAMYKTRQTSLDGELGSDTVAAPDLADAALRRNARENLLKLRNQSAGRRGSFLTGGTGNVTNPMPVKSILGGS